MGIMAETYLGYDLMLQEALRGVVRETLSQVASRGILGNHHFLISFRTGQPGVDIPEFLRSQYPDEMTIVLQNQFSGLEVSDDAFSVSLSFNKVPAHLTIPFAAVTRFADPPANFGLQLVATEAEGSAPILAGARDAKALPKPDAESGTGGEAKTAKVVALDSFRKS